MKSLVLISLFFSFTALAQKNAPADPVVAEVNGQKILKSTLIKYHTQNLNFVRSGEVPTLEKSLNDLIDRIIGIANGKKAKIHERPDVVKKMNDIVYHAYISDALTPLLKGIKVTKEEIDNYYKNNPEYRTSNILIRLRTLPSDEEVALGLEKIQTIYKQVKEKPSNFASLATVHSQTQNSLNGGDMGYQPRPRLTKQYYDAIKGKKVGFITQPFRSQYGWHIVKVTGIKKREQIDEKLYEKIVYDQKRDKILADYFKKERKNAKIKLNTKELKL